jgi:hypothetical protein
MNKDIKVMEKEIKKLKRINRILIIYVVLSIVIMLYNAFFSK